MTRILVPIFGIVFGCGIALLAIWTEHRRDRAPIEEGLYQPEKPELAGPSGQGFLVGGSILGGIGIASVVSTFGTHTGEATGLSGFFLFIGLALLIVYFAAAEKQLTSKD